MTYDEIITIVNLTEKEKLTEISLSRYEGEIPKKLYSLEWLTHLYFYECPNIDITEILSMRNLRTLHLRFCKLSELISFEKLINLTELNFEGNYLKDLPKNLPASLISLDISDNCISSLNVIEHLYNLMELFAINNKIKELPNFLKNERLTLIEVGNNMISNFPKEFVESNFVKLDSGKFDIHIYDNPFIDKLILTKDNYVLRAEWSYIEGLSNSEYLIQDYINLYGYNYDFSV